MNAVQSTYLLLGPFCSGFDCVRGMGRNRGFLRLANSRACCRLDEVSFAPRGLVWMDGRGRGSSWSGCLDAMICHDLGGGWYVDPGSIPMLLLRHSAVIALAINTQTFRLSYLYLGPCELVATTGLAPRRRTLH